MGHKAEHVDIRMGMQPPKPGIERNISYNASGKPELYYAYARPPSWWLDVHEHMALPVVHFI